MSMVAMILAAGGSRRLGEPKQLLTTGGETLLNRAIRIAREAGAFPVLVVLGAHFERIVISIESKSAIVVRNDRWRQGMGRSIQTGMRALNVCAPDAERVLLMSCDQPRLTAEHLRAMMNAVAAQDSPAMAASAYAGVRGIPAVFPREVFGQLGGLRGDQGARSVLENAICPVLPIGFEGGEVDIDRPEDLVQLG